MKYRFQKKMYEGCPHPILDHKASATKFDIRIKTLNLATCCTNNYLTHR